MVDKMGGKGWGRITLQNVPEAYFMLCFCSELGHMTRYTYTKQKITESLTNFGDTSEVQAVRFTIDLFAKSALISIRTS